MSDPLQTALRHHQAGRLQEAEAHATAALRLNPRNPVTLHLLGLIAARLGRTQEAIDHLETAAGLAASDPIVLSNLAEVLRSANHLTRSIAIFQRAIKLKCDHVPAHFGLAMALHADGRAVEALAACDAATRLDPESARSDLLRSAILQSQRKLPEAVQAARAAIRLEPASFQAHHHLGLLLADTGDFRDAIVALREAERLQPKSAKVQLALGLVLAATGDARTALAAYDRSLQLNPNDAETHYHIGDLVSRRGSAADALRHYEIAVRLRPEYAEAHNDRAVLLLQLGRLTDAETAARQAIAIRPNYFQAYQTLGSSLQESARHSEAIAAFQHSLTIRPDADGAGNLLMALHYPSPLDGAALAEAHRAWGRTYGEPLRSGFTPHVRSDAGRKVRIAYISPDFRQHSVNFFAEALLRSYDRERFEVTCYSDVARPDEVTDRLRAGVDRWRDTYGMPDAHLTDVIRADEIDILVDLAGHTGGNRLLVFARRCAPVQVTYLGYPDTTGLAEMDYRLTDALADPPGVAELFHTERLLRISPCAWCYTPPANAPMVTPSPAQRNGFVTFASFNRLAKISEATLDLWIATLSAVPRSRLLLKAKGLHDAAVCERLKSLFARRGVHRDRLIFAPHAVGFAEHLAAYGEADIALDSFPYNGTTTTCEALLMGLPVVTVVGQVHAARVGLSLLSAINSPEWAATAPERFVEVAGSLADNPVKLEEIRNALRARLLSSQLTNAAGFARTVEAAYADLV